jgi:hypothetical protein
MQLLQLTPPEERALEIAFCDFKLGRPPLQLPTLSQSTAQSKLPTCACRAQLTSRSVTRRALFKILEGHMAVSSNDRAFSSMARVSLLVPESAGMLAWTSGALARRSRPRDVFVEIRVLAPQRED